MQHSQSDVALGTGGSWADLKVAEGLKKRSNTAQNLQFYGSYISRLVFGRGAHVYFLAIWRSWC